MEISAFKLQKAALHIDVYLVISDLALTVQRPFEPVRVRDLDVLRLEKSYKRAGIILLENAADHHLKFE